MFTNDEVNLMCIYNTGTREGLIDSLTDMQRYLGADENDLRALTDSTINKLTDMSDKAFGQLKLYPEFV